MIVEKVLKVVMLQKDVLIANRDHQVYPEDADRCGLRVGQILKTNILTSSGTFHCPASHSSS